MFQIGDKVREGYMSAQLPTSAPVLIQVKTSEGTSRVVCPWELVLMRASRDGIGSNLAAE